MKESYPDAVQNNRNKRISVVTPSYNQGRYIEETILSVLNQDYPNFEYIVIDGGSNDSTKSILKKYEHQLQWISETDNGQTDAINKGIKLCSGDIVAYLNSDDIYLPGAFHKVAEYFDKHSNIAMVYGNVIHIDPESHIIGKHRTGQIDLEKYLLKNIYLPQPTVFFRSNVISELGYFDEKLDLAMDVDYWIRIMKHFKIGYIDNYLAAARIYPEAKSAFYDLRYFDDFLRIYQKTFEKQDSSNEMERLKRGFLSRIYLDAASIKLGRLLIKDSRENFITGFKYRPSNIFNFYYLIRFLGTMMGERITRFFLEVKRKVAPDIL